MYWLPAVQQTNTAKLAVFVQTFQTEMRALRLTEATCFKNLDDPSCIDLTL